ncbi:MAG: SDR family NAD(P)-dependent oxidoreductase [Bacteriovoracaceae bacterium]|nr:SDR family NAD(P)-dependent oxidoreductase [Bacteriovoracaceae bacterium]
MAKYYLAHGHMVAVCSFEKTSDVASKIPSNLLYFQADVRDEAAMTAAVQAFNQKVSGIDLLICNAGISMEKKAIPDFKKGKMVAEVNIIGVLNTIAPAVEIMKKQNSGHIVGIASFSSLVGLPGMAIYGGSKAFILNFFESLNLDLKQYGIHTTCFVPGFIDTPLTQVNQHKMPALVPLPTAIKIMTNAIAAKKELVFFPQRLAIVMKILRLLPRFLYRALMRLDLLGFRKQEHT